MLTEKENAVSQVQVICIEDLVPRNHLLRKIERAIDWSFIYELVKDKYCLDNGRPSIDPVTLIKIPMLQYLYGIKKYASDYQRNRSKCGISLVFRTGFNRFFVVIISFLKNLTFMMKKVGCFT